MPTVLKLLYGVAAAIWLGLGYIVVKLFVPPLPADHNPHTMAAAYCLLLIGGLPLPTLVGYVLFFRVLPWIGRSLRRA